MTKSPGSRIGKLIRTYALAYPETTETFPWGEHAFKVNRKTFVFMRDDGDETSFSVKLSRSRAKAFAASRIGADALRHGRERLGDAASDVEILGHSRS